MKYRRSKQWGLKKLKALAERGEGGEAANAKAMLDNLLKKNNMTLEDIEQEVKSDHVFKVEGELNKRLIIQICKHVNRDIAIYHIKRGYIREVGGNILMQCTAAEYILIDQMYAHYRVVMEKEMDIFFSAFIAANSLFASYSDLSFEDLNQEQKERIARRDALARNIKRETFCRQLTG